MEVGDLAVHIDPDAFSKIASQINLRYKRATNTCHEHKRKHQRCPPECIGRKKEKSTGQAVEPSLTSEVVMINGKEKIVLGVKKSKPNPVEDMEDTALQTLISRFNTFQPQPGSIATSTVPDTTPMEMEKPIPKPNEPTQRFAETVAAGHSSSMKGKHPDAGQPNGLPPSVTDKPTTESNIKQVESRWTSIAMTLSPTMGFKSRRHSNER
jgi:hypothetical protein